MSQGKTEFRVTFNAAPEEVNRIIQQYLSANGFAREQKENANYYVSKTGLSQRRFEYYINGNQLLVLAYMGTYEKPQELEGVAGALPKQAYKNEIAMLFQEINRIGEVQKENSYQRGINQGSNYQGSINQGSSNQVNYMDHSGTNAFAEANNKKNETWATVGFVISIIGLLSSCVGISFGIFLIIFEFWCASVGLKTKKRGLAIATIVLAIVSILIIVLQLVVRFMAA